MRRFVKALRAGAAALLCLLPTATSFAAPAPTGKGGVTVTRWAEGLSAPQGIALDTKGNVLIVENGAGRVTRFGRDGGARLGVAAEGLKAPAWALSVGGVLYVSEREGNSVARIEDGKVTRLPGEVIDPLGIVTDPRKADRLLVVSHRQSVVRQFALSPEGGQPATAALLAESFASVPEGAKYGWRDLALAKDSTLYITDELSGGILRRKPGGALEAWATGLSSPSGLAVTPGGDVLVTEEGNGRLSRLSSDGKATVLAEGLGRAREALFLDAKTLLVTDRAGGVVWKVTLP